MMNSNKTQPKLRFPEDCKVDTNKLTASRYGTKDMRDIWDAEKTYEFSLKVQGQSAITLSKLYPNIISQDCATEIFQKANLNNIDTDRIRILEEEKGHDIIAINTALEEILSSNSKTHVNKAKTSADTTQPARALQFKSSLEIIADSVENLRDIIIEKSIEWKDIPFMDVTHLYDALPTVAGRPFSHYAEMLQSGLNLLKFVYDNSIKGKWADATGNHHSATALGIDGIKLQEQFCRDLGISYMDAPAQIPGLEFEADIAYLMSRFSETINNIAKFIAWGRSSDVDIFINGAPKKQKASSAMPHKDHKKGNPVIEEQDMSLRNYLMGNTMTALANCELPYARNLAASANSRINFEDGFKFLDHGIRNLSYLIYYLLINQERSIERINRSYGIVTSQQVMTYLTDQRKTSKPMSRSEAHDLMGQLATQSWNSKINFTDIVLANDKVTSRLDEQTIRSITNPINYIGESKKIIDIIASKYYKEKTLH